MGKCASKCCFCVPNFKEGADNRTGRNKFEPAIQFTITATPQKDGSKDEADPDFIPPPQSNLAYEEELKRSTSEGLGDFDDILFGRDDFDSKSLDEISLSKEMDNRSKEIMQSYQLRGSLLKEDNYSKNETFTRPTSSSEDSCLPESIPSTHPLPKGGDSESVISSESYDEEMLGSRNNPGFIRDEDFRIGSCHYKTEVIGEVKSVYSSDADSCGKVTTANLTLIDRCMGLELNENDDVLEMSSVRFVLGENNASASSSPASLDSFSLETVFPMSLGKNQLGISDEVQTRL